MNAERQTPNPPRKVRIRKGAQNASQAVLDRVARGLPRWAARLVRKVARQPARPPKPAPLADHSPTPSFHHAD